MRKLIAILFVLFLISIVCETAEARIFGRHRSRRSQNYTYTYNVNVWNGAQTDQARCEAEAAYMAANYIYGHVGGQIGNFEGWGHGNSTDCATCVPGWNATLTGFGWAQASNGTIFVVKSWR